MYRTVTACLCLAYNKDIRQIETICKILDAEIGYRMVGHSGGAILFENYPSEELIYCVSGGFQNCADRPLASQSIPLSVVTLLNGVCF